LEFWCFGSSDISMSDREFENYLTLLSGLLRLDGKQRGAIAAELRSHLEDRLEELIEQGVSRDEAVRRALAEFGDAAGLAGQFVAISRNRKRRWLMRLTTFSVAATLLVAAGLAILWPGRHAAPGAANLVAQEAPAVERTAATSRQPQDEPTLDEKLNQRIDVDFEDVALKDAISYIQEHTGIQFVIRKKRLEEASVNPETPVTQRLNRVRVSTLLDLMLGELELTYVDRDDLLHITTPEDAESQLLIRVYDCRDLLTMAAPRPVPTAIGPTPVPSFTPPATSVIPPSLTPQNLVPQAAPGGLRWVPAPGGPVVPPTPVVPSLPLPASPSTPSNNAPTLRPGPVIVAPSLEGPQLAPPSLQTASPAPGTGYFGAILDDAEGRAVRVISVKPGGPAEMVGLKPNDLIISFSEKPTPSIGEFDAALNLHRGGQQVTVTFLRDGVQHAANCTLWTRVAPPTVEGTPVAVPAAQIIPPPPTRAVPSLPRATLPQMGGLERGLPLAQGVGGGMGGMGGGLGGVSGVRRSPPPAGSLEARAYDLIDVVTSTVDPQTWDDVGGPGSICAYNGLVVVATTAHTHKKVEHLFDMLREAAGLEVPKTGKVVR
jgi:membrane-associated protease RseP (regulator of RpoE activity)